MWGKRSRESAAAETPQRTVTVQCPLCGNRFDPAQSQACAHCPKLFRSCGMVVCPRCSHEFVRM
ncbi:MAG: hypothetical protein ACLQCB_05465 [Spirochaetia bacterium]